MDVPVLSPTARPTSATRHSPAHPQAVGRAGTGPRAHHSHHLLHPRPNEPGTAGVTPCVDHMPFPPSFYPPLAGTAGCQLGATLARQVSSCRWVRYKHAKPVAETAPAGFPCCEPSKRSMKLVLGNLPLASSTWASSPGTSYYMLMGCYSPPAPNLPSPMSLRVLLYPPTFLQVPPHPSTFLHIPRLLHPGKKKEH